MAKARKGRKATAKKAARKTSAKKATRKSIGRRAGARVGRVASSINLKAELAKLDAQRKKLVDKSVKAKEALLKKATAARDEAQAKVDALEKELKDFYAEAGLAAPKRRGRPPKGAKKGAAKPKKRGRKAGSGRKPRVETPVKQAAVAETLKKHPGGIQFSALKKELAKQKTKEGAPIFGTADFNSAATFASKLLPKTHKVQGSHRAAKVVKK